MNNTHLDYGFPPALPSKKVSRPWSHGPLQPRIAPPSPLEEKKQEPINRWASETQAPKMLGTQPALVLKRRIMCCKSHDLYN